MIRITPRAVILFACGIPIALLPTLVPGGAVAIWLAFILVTVLTLGIEFWRLPGRRAIESDVEHPTSFYLGADTEVALVLETNPANRGLEIEARLETSPELVGPSYVQFVLDPATVRFSTRLSGRTRGKASIDNLWLRWRSPWRLLEVMTKRRLDRLVLVVPNLPAVRDAAIQFFISSQYTGFKSQKYLGDGSEFDSMREFVPGLDSRSIDWKATARHRKYMSRQFRAERNHHVLLAIDTGWRMREPYDQIPKLDHAIKSALTLAYVALKTGDRVGFFSFADQPGPYLAPQGGMESLLRIQTRAAELEYSTSEANYTLGLTDLATRLKRRSLVVVMTDFFDSISAELLVENLGRLANRHVIIFVSYRDPSLERLVSAPLDTGYDLNLAVVARNQLRDREVIMKKLDNLGILCVDSLPNRVTASLLSSYLHVRKRELV